MAHFSFAFDSVVNPVTDPAEVSITATAVVRAARLWKLSETEGAALFDVPLPTSKRMEQGTFKGRLDRNKAMRASLIIGIFARLRTLFNGPLSKDWPHMPNRGSLFRGRRPVDMMIAGTSGGSNGTCPIRVMSTFWDSRTGNMRTSYASTANRDAANARILVSLLFFEGFERLFYHPRCSSNAFIFNTLVEHRG
jgi:hypothetical protein